MDIHACSEVSRDDGVGAATEDGDHDRINDQYRICFTWKEDGAYDVEIVDYH